LIVNAREVNDDGITLTDDFGFGNAKRVNAISNTFYREVKAHRVIFADWFLSNRNSALQVETESRLIVGDEVAGQRTENDDDEADE
jgi:hypothetical protein